jgi:UDP-N-acetylmuramate dehydrogenase
MSSAMSAAALADALCATLDAGRVRVREPLGPYTTFRIGGPADVLYDATSEDDLASAITAARALGVPWFVLGLGANILVATAVSAGS